MIVRTGTEGAHKRSLGLANHFVHLFNMNFGGIFASDCEDAGSEFDILRLSLRAFENRTDNRSISAAPVLVPRSLPF